MRRRNWLAIQVELIAGLGRPLWPRPGRLFAVARSHSFAEFAAAIDQALGRWDPSKPAKFVLDDNVHITLEESDPVKIGELNQGDRLAYVFDGGNDGWQHLCTVIERPFDPRKTLLVEPPEVPSPYWGWGSLPDQHGLRWAKDDGHKPGPRQPAQPFDDLPALLPGWGAQ